MPVAHLPPPGQGCAMVQEFNPPCHPTAHLAHLPLAHLPLFVCPRGFVVVGLRLPPVGACVLRTQQGVVRSPVVLYVLASQHCRMFLLSYVPASHNTQQNHVL